MVETECPTCKGKRLQKSVLSIYINGKNIFDLTDMNLTKLKNFLESLKLNEEEFSYDFILKVESIN